MAKTLACVVPQVATSQRRHSAAGTWKLVLSALSFHRWSTVLCYGCHCTCTTQLTLRGRAPRMEPVPKSSSSRHLVLLITAVLAGEIAALAEGRRLQLWGVPLAPAVL